MVKIILNVCRYIMNRNIGNVDERAEILCYNFTNTETLTVVPILTASEFVQEQSLRILNNEEKLDYSTLFKLEYAQQEGKRLNIPDKFRFNTKQFNIDMRMILNSAISLYTIIYLHESEQNKYKYVRVIFNIIYLISWSYILWISAPDLLLSLGIYILQYVTKIEEPFSGLII
jgi:hypothetical protein